MGMKEKMSKAKQADWVSDGMPESEVSAAAELAKISAKIERCRLDMGMTQTQFAEYMGVSQGMISKWESREYNFTIKSLHEICKKLHLSMHVEMERMYVKSDYVVLECAEEQPAVLRKKKKDGVAVDPQA